MSIICKYRILDNIYYNIRYYMMNMSKTVFFDCHWNNDAKTAKYIYELIDPRFIDVMIEIDKNVIVCMQIILNPVIFRSISPINKCQITCKIILPYGNEVYR